AARSHSLNDLFCGRVDRFHVLPVNALALDSESGGARQHVTGDRLRVVRVLVVEVVLADINYGQLPKCRHVHDFVKQALSKRSITEETDGYLSGTEPLGRESGSGRNAGTSTDNGISPEIARIRVGDMHRTALALAVTGFFAEQLGKHAIQRSSFGQTVPVAAMRARDVVVGIERFTNPDGDG